MRKSTTKFMKFRWKSKNGRKLLTQYVPVTQNSTCRSVQKFEESFTPFTQKPVQILRNRAKQKRIDFFARKIEAEPRDFPTKISQNRSRALHQQPSTMVSSPFLLLKYESPLVVDEGYGGLRMSWSDFLSSETMVFRVIAARAPFCSWIQCTCGMSHEWPSVVDCFVFLFPSLIYYRCCICGSCALILSFLLLFLSTD